MIAAKAVAFHEALQPEFKDYQQQVKKNIKAMVEVFNEAEEPRVIMGATENHLTLIDVTGFDLTGKEAEHLLDEVKITVNKNTIPFETKSPFVTSGIRIGTPAITSRGFDEEDARKVAELIVRTLRAKEDEAEQEAIRQEVKVLTDKNPLYK